MILIPPAVQTIEALLVQIYNPVLLPFLELNLS